MITRQERMELKGRAGFIAAYRNKVNQGLVVLYDADAAGLDRTGGGVVCVCEQHGTLKNFRSRWLARQWAITVFWCEECNAERKGEQWLTPL